MNKEVVEIAGKLIIFGLLIIILITFVCNYYKEHHGYRYVTFKDEIGISRKCYINDDGLFCKIKGGLVEVKQFGKR